MAPILCAVDFSHQSRLALQWAAALAARRQRPLTVVHCIDPLLAHTARIRLGISLIDADALEELQRFGAASIPESITRRLSWTAKMVVGDASSTIVHAASRERAELIVMGTHGLGGLRKLLLGSTAQRVLAQTSVPVLMVPCAEDEALPATDPTERIGRILVTTDFEATAVFAMQWAAALAKTLAVPMTLMHVVKPVSVPEQWRCYVDAFDEAHLDQARRQLADLSTQLGDRPAVCEPIAKMGHPAETIAALAQERHAGLIVMGLANRKDGKTSAPGTVAYGVVRLSQLPVLVVPAPVEAAIPESSEGSSSSAGP